MLMRGVSEIDSEISLTIDGTFDVDVHVDEVYDTSAKLDMGSSTLTQDGHLTVKADQTGGYDATLEITAGTVNVASGKKTKIEGGGDTDNAVATLKLSGATCDPADLQLSGGESAVRKAFLDLDSGTLTNPDTLKMEGYAEIDSEINISVVGALTVDRDAGDAFDTDAHVDMNTGTALTVGSMTIGHTSRSVTLTLQGEGTCAISGKVSTVKPTSDNVHPKLAVASTVASPVTADSMEIAGGDVAIRSAQLDFDQNVTVSGDVDVEQYVDIDIASGETLTIDNDLLIGNDDGVNDDYDGVLTVSGGGTISADRIVIEGESGTGSSLTVSSSTVETS